MVPVALLPAAGILLGLGAAFAMYRQADPWFASTQVCSACGENGGRKGLHIREWTCAACGAHHDRDVNASLNLLRLAEDIMSSGQGLPDELGQ